MYSVEELKLIKAGFIFALEELSTTLAIKDAHIRFKSKDNLDIVISTPLARSDRVNIIDSMIGDYNYNILEICEKDYLSDDEVKSIKIYDEDIPSIIYDI